MLFSQKPDFGHKRSPEEVNLQQWINGTLYMDLLKGGFLAFLVRARFWSQEVTKNVNIHLTILLPLLFCYEEDIGWCFLGCMITCSTLTEVYIHKWSNLIGLPS